LVLQALDAIQQELADEKRERRRVERDLEDAQDEIAALAASVSELQSKADGRAHGSDQAHAALQETIAELQVCFSHWHVQVA
jgi:peptidoglycan hydrolase CwlO-like protein